MKTKLVDHEPVWATGPVKIDREGSTKTGFICVHWLENGNGLCGASVIDERDTHLDDEHSCFIAVRGWWNVSRPCYDKYRRCPGWAGGGWKGAKRSLCHGEDGIGGYLNVDYENRWWRWKTHRCVKCGVIVLPYVTHWLSWRTWWYKIKYFGNSWAWFRLRSWWRGESSVLWSLALGYAVMAAIVIAVVAGVALLG